MDSAASIKDMASEEVKSTLIAIGSWFESEQRDGDVILQCLRALLESEQSFAHQAFSRTFVRICQESIASVPLSHALSREFQNDAFVSHVHSDACSSIVMSPRTLSETSHWINRLSSLCPNDSTFKVSDIVYWHTLSVLVLMLHKTHAGPGILSDHFHRVLESCLSRCERSFREMMSYYPKSSSFGCCTRTGMYIPMALYLSGSPSEDRDVITGAQSSLFPDEAGSGSSSCRMQCNKLIQAKSMFLQDLQTFHQLLVATSDALYSKLLTRHPRGKIDELLDEERGRNNGRIDATATLPIADLLSLFLSLVPTIQRFFSFADVMIKEIASYDRWNYRESITSLSTSTAPDHSLDQCTGSIVASTASGNKVEDEHDPPVPYLYRNTEDELTHVKVPLAREITATVTHVGVFLQRFSEILYSHYASEPDLLLPPSETVPIVLPAFLSALTANFLQVFRLILSFSRIPHFAYVTQACHSACALFLSVLDSPIVPIQRSIAKIFVTSTNPDMDTEYHQFAAKMANLSVLDPLALSQAICSTIETTLVALFSKQIGNAVLYFILPRSIGTQLQQMQGLEAWASMVSLLAKGTQSPKTAPSASPSTFASSPPSSVPFSVTNTSSANAEGNATQTQSPISALQAASAHPAGHTVSHQHSSAGMLLLRTHFSEFLNALKPMLKYEDFPPSVVHASITAITNLLRVLPAELFREHVQSLMHCMVNILNSTEPTLRGSTNNNTKSDRKETDSFSSTIFPPRLCHEVPLPEKLSTALIPPPFYLHIYIVHAALEFTSLLFERHEEVLHPFASQLFVYCARTGISFPYFSPTRHSSATFLAKLLHIPNTSFSVGMFTETPMSSQGSPTVSSIPSAASFALQSTFPRSNAHTNANPISDATTTTTDLSASSDNFPPSSATSFRSSAIAFTTDSSRHSSVMADSTPPMSSGYPITTTAAAIQQARSPSARQSHATVDASGNIVFPKRDRLQRSSTPVLGNDVKHLTHAMLELLVVQVRNLFLVTRDIPDLAVSKVFVDAYGSGVGRTVTTPPQSEREAPQDKGRETDYAHTVGYDMYRVLQHRAQFLFPVPQILRLPLKSWISFLAVKLEQSREKSQTQSTVTTTSKYAIRELRAPSPDVPSEERESTIVQEIISFLEAFKESPENPVIGSAASTQQTTNQTTWMSLVELDTLAESIVLLLEQLVKVDDKRVPILYESLQGLISEANGRTDYSLLPRLQTTLWETLPRIARSIGKQNARNHILTHFLSDALNDIRIGLGSVVVSSIPQPLGRTSVQSIHTPYSSNSTEFSNDSNNRSTAISAHHFLSSMRDFVGPLLFDARMSQSEMDLYLRSCREL